VNGGEGIIRYPQIFQQVTRRNDVILSHVQTLEASYFPFFS